MGFSGDFKDLEKVEGALKGKLEIREPETLFLVIIFEKMHFKVYMFVTWNCKIGCINALLQIYANSCKNTGI